MAGKIVLAQAKLERERESEEIEMEFPAFPYEPYSIQIDFMRALYRFMDKGGVSMLESPTGTGKTLSIICSALQWLVDKREREGKCESETRCDQNESYGSDGEPDWMKNYSADKGNSPVENNKSRFRSGLSKYGKVVPTSKGVYSIGKSGDGVVKRAEILVKSEEVLEEEGFLLDEYESDGELGIDGNRPKRKTGGLSVGSSSDEEDYKDENNDCGVRDGFKIYFCSRTHSQLSQFLKEMKKTQFSSVISVVCLGSRKNLCINEEVLKLGSSTGINERCLQLQKNKVNKATKVKNSVSGCKTQKTKASCGCPMLKHILQKQFRAEVSERGVLDIEDLVTLGRNVGTCAYYGSRSMVPTADLVVLPYQSLFSKSCRESLGLSLKNNIIIVDEAHNLADSLISMYDAKISSTQLERVQLCIESYYSRFRKFLGAGNRRYIQTLLILTRAFLKALRGDETFATSFENMENNSWTAVNVVDSTFSINDFLFLANIDNINLVKLLGYLRESKIIHKVSGYGDKVNSSSISNSTVISFNESVDEESTISGFQALVSMLQSLTNNDGDGRMIVSKVKPGCIGQAGYIKYVMLTGKNIFSEIADQAHAVILAGGTLQPIEETRERLFPQLSSNQLQFFSCSHIVPPESILPMSISRGPSGHSFDFSFNSRSSPIMMEELGLLLCNIVTVVPEGIVVFFSSFDYEALVYKTWKDSGILERIMKRKRVFREPRKSTDVEGVLQEYKEAIDKLSNKNPQENLYLGNGAMLLAVVGGKISEGINFSDGMGRCIVMTGLPYPSPSDIELIERIKHIEGLRQSNFCKSRSVSAPHSGDIQAGFDIIRSCKRRGKEYYENLCMKAVNQSIGRAIRHINDYAAILLVDSRYATDSSARNIHHPTNKLPQWIKNRLVSTISNYGEAHRLLHQFFKSNKNRGQK